ncbi:MAG: hypothetical protein COU25_02920 [Candidatus Levybacteria bacterium CG10_big_fil_rev_8_21_14_0_10_35_13]|nr:MAG: hypothetical protein COU25_02920 [Candidatus Levybacteria bacterium CG10_big_fil_rev_8_21_14_0_10_35_13]
MTKVSKRLLDKNLENRIFEVFIKTIVDLKNPNDVQNFINDLLSPVERIMLVKRLAIAILLTKGYTYQMIDDTLKVSHPTIMKVSLELKYGINNGYKRVVDNFLEHEKREELIDKIEELLLQISPPKALGSLAFEKKRQKGKELFRRKVKRSHI